MITVLTHKSHKSRFEHSKPIYVFTIGRVIVTVQIYSRKKLLKRLKWPPQNGPLIPESNKICTILLQDWMKRGVCQCGWGGDALSLQVWLIDVYYIRVMPQVRSDQFLIYWGINQVVSKVWRFMQCFSIFHLKHFFQKIVIGNICGIVVN